MMSARITGPCLLRSLLQGHRASYRCYHGSKVAASETDVHVVDIRSDTVTKPSGKMRRAMADADVGDDVYGEDPTVNRLQQECAELFGMEAALFVPTGTMGNLISVMAHSNTRGCEVLLGDRSHIHLYEQGGVSQLGGVHPRALQNLPDGTFSLDQMRFYIRPRGDTHQPLTRLVCIENTQNYLGGKVVPSEFIFEVKKLANEHDINVHLDGARLMNAAVAQNKHPSEVLKDCDSVSMCFSKGLGAPIGSVIAGSAEFIERMRCIDEKDDTKTLLFALGQGFINGVVQLQERGSRLRKALGGGMRQVGVIAAAALISLTDVAQRLQNDHNNAQLISKAINRHGGGVMNVQLQGVHTNIVMCEVVKVGLTAEQFCQRMAQVSELEKMEHQDPVIVKMIPWTTKSIRFVTHNNLTDEDVQLAVKKFDFVLEEFSS